jgi:hypothetical protein
LRIHCGTLPKAMSHKVIPDKTGSSTYCAGVLIANKITEGIGQDKGMDVRCGWCLMLLKLRNALPRWQNLRPIDEEWFRSTDAIQTQLKGFWLHRREFEGQTLPHDRCMTSETLSKLSLRVEPRRVHFELNILFRAQSFLSDGRDLCSVILSTFTAAL